MCLESDKLLVLLKLSWKKNLGCILFKNFLTYIVIQFNVVNSLVSLIVWQSSSDTPSPATSLNVWFENGIKISFTILFMYFAEHVDGMQTPM